MNNRVNPQERCEKCETLIGRTYPIHQLECCKVVLCEGCVGKHKCLQENIQENKKYCFRCLAKPFTYFCKSCKNGCYCEQCFREIHKVGKFATHPFKIFGDDEGKDETYREKINQIQEEIKIHTLQYELLEKNIAKKWDELIHGVEQQFNGLVDEIVQKKKQLKQKISIRKEKELFKLRQILKSKVQISTEKKISKESMMKLEYQVRELRSAMQDTKGEKFQCNYQLLEKPFEEVRKLVSKIGTKNILEKQQKVVETSHNRVLSSMRSTGSSVFAANSLLRKKNFELSRSTFQCDLHSEEKHEKQNLQKEKGVKNSDKKQISRVKSEKWLGYKMTKSPQPIKNYFLTKKTAKTQK